MFKNKFFISLIFLFSTFLIFSFTINKAYALKIVDTNEIVDSVRFSIISDDYKIFIDGEAQAGNLIDYINSYSNSSSGNDITFTDLKITDTNEIVSSFRLVYINNTIEVYIDDVKQIDDLYDYINSYSNSSSGNDITLISLEKTTRPAISGKENFVTNVDDSKDLSFFQSYLTAFDETDGDLTSKIYVELDNYTANKSVLGSHKVIWGVKDLSGNIATLEAYIRVIDITNPVISGNKSVSKIGYKDTFNIETFRKTLSVSDNYDSLLNSDIKLKTDGYTNNKGSLGTYELTFEVKDSSGNIGVFVKQVEVIDDVAPTFSGPLTFSASNSTILTESDIRSKLIANDEIDGNLTARIILIEDNYTGKGNKVGNYTIVYSVTDNAGNVGYHTVTIQRSDKLPPTIWIEDGVSIITTPTAPLTKEQIISILQTTNQVSSSSTTSFSFLLDEYVGNEEVAGVYAMSIKARAVDGNESLHNMSITVLSDGIDDSTVIDGDESFYTTKNITIILSSIAGVTLLGYFLFRKKR